MGLIFMVLFLS